MWHGTWYNCFKHILTAAGLRALNRYSVLLQHANDVLVDQIKLLIPEKIYTNDNPILYFWSHLVLGSFPAVGRKYGTFSVRESIKMALWASFAADIEFLYCIFMILCVFYMQYAAFCATNDWLFDISNTMFKFTSVYFYYFLHFLL